MTSAKQIEANRRNAARSSGPRTPEGKRQSRCNALRHGLTAETVIPDLEDADDYKAFELAITSDYDAETVVEREMVLRLASILWRLRRATGIETALFEFAAREKKELSDETTEPVLVAGLLEHQNGSNVSDSGRDDRTTSSNGGWPSTEDIAKAYLRLVALPTFPLDRLTRYEPFLWRQARQLVFTLETLRRRTTAAHRVSFPFTFRTTSR